MAKKPTKPIDIVTRSITFHPLDQEMLDEIKRAKNLRGTNETIRFVLKLAHGVVCGEATA